MAEKARFCFFNGEVSIPLMNLSMYNNVDYFVVYTMDEKEVDFIGYIFASDVYNSTAKPQNYFKGLKSIVKGGIVTSGVPLRSDWDFFKSKDTKVQKELSL